MTQPLLPFPDGTPVSITKDEAELLDMFLDWWLEGYDEAEQQTIADHSIDTPEELLALMATYAKDRRVGADLKVKMQEVLERVGSDN
jgi:hypothetical protein